jgi:hypothetical protein
MSQPTIFGVGVPKMKLRTIIPILALVLAIAAVAVS